MIADEKALLELLKTVEINNDRYILINDKRGNANLQIRVNGKEWTLHSKYDAVKEGRAFARKSMFSSDIIVLGLGFGYHIEPMLSMLQLGRALYIFETDIQVLKLAFENTDICQLLEDERVKFFAGNGFKSVRKQLSRFILANNIAVVTYEPALKTWSDGIEMIFGMLELKLACENDYLLKFDEMRMRNFVNNIVPLEKPVNVAFLRAVLARGPAYDYFAKNLYVGFAMLGCCVDFLTDEELESAIDNPKDLRWDLFITFNTHMYDIECNGKPFFDVAGRKLVSISVDRPYHLTHSRVQGPHNAIYTWISKDDLEYAGRFYFTKGCHEFLAHGAEVIFGWKNAPRENRSIDVLITSNLSAGSFLDRLREQVGPEDFEMFEKIAEYSLLHMDKTMEECVVDWNIMQGGEGIEEFLEAVMHVAGLFMDGYRRETLKYKIVKSLLDAGIEIHCVGGGWEYTDLIDHPLFIWYGPVKFDACRELIGCSKILINIMSTFLDGSHERVFDSMIRETLCMTEGGNYLREIFTDGEEIVFFDHTNIPDMTEKIRYYLDNDTEREKITKAAFEKVRNEHTWAHRAKEIIDLWKNE